MVAVQIEDSSHPPIFLFETLFSCQCPFNFIIYCYWIWKTCLIANFKCTCSTHCKWHSCDDVFRPPQDYDLRKMGIFHDDWQLANEEYRYRGVGLCTVMYCRNIDYLDNKTLPLFLCFLHPRFNIDESSLYIFLKS
jgi:hypothetical protein